MRSFVKRSRPIRGPGTHAPCVSPRGSRFNACDMRDSVSFHFSTFFSVPLLSFFFYNFASALLEKLGKNLEG